MSEEVVVVLVDGDHLLNAPELDDTFHQQIEAADIVLLNKVDLLDDPAIQQAHRRLDALTGGQPIFHTVRSHIDPALLFPPDPQGARRERRDPDAALAPHLHDCFVTHELDFPGVVEPEAVLAAIQRHDAIRAKGFVCTPGGLRVVQGVGHRIEVTAPSGRVPDELIGRIVVIRREEGQDVHG